MRSDGHGLDRGRMSGVSWGRGSLSRSARAAGGGVGQAGAMTAMAPSFSPSGPGSSWLLVPILGATAIFQVVVVPKLAVRGVYPDLILLIVIARSLVAGRRGALMWAFVGGLWMDVLSGGVMGASSLALMATSLLTGIGHNAIFRRNSLVPLVAALSGSLIFSLIYLAILGAVGYRFPPGLLVVNLLIPATVYNSALMFIATPILNRLPEQARIH